MTLDLVTLPAGNPSAMTGTGNWTYLVRGERPVLIDAGVGATSHVDAIAGVVPDGPALVVVTHAHDDHASGASTIARRFPNARFVKVPWPERDDAAVAWTALADGDRIDTAAGPLEVLHTPGHAPDHIALWHAGSRVAFTGDLLVLGGTVVVPGSRGGRLADYLASLRRLAALAPRRALPAHGPPIDDPRALVETYISHRLAREQQVLDALHAGAETPTAIADRLYPHLDRALVPVAHESVLAHLVKLLDEGRATCVEGLWAPAQ